MAWLTSYNISRDVEEFLRFFLYALYFKSSVKLQLEYSETTSRKIISKLLLDNFKNDLRIILDYFKTKSRLLQYYFKTTPKTLQDYPSQD